MLPLVLFLSLRPSPLPSVAYIEAIQLHKWISRIVVLAGFLHSLAYLAHFVNSKRLDKLFRIKNFLGLIILIFMLTMAIASLKPIRRRFYRLFYYLHYPLAWLVVGLTIIHARPSVYILAFWCFALLIGQIVFRVVTSYKVEDGVSVYQISQTLKLVILPRNVLPNYFTMGSHVRLSRPLTRVSAWINPTHPYTIASLPEDSEVRLLVREPSQKPKFAISSNEKLSITGPYPSVAADIYAHAQKVLVFAGGSGLSYGASVYRGLERKGVEVKLVWMVRNRSEITALGLLEVSHADVYITSGGVRSRYSRNNANSNGRGNTDTDNASEGLVGNGDVFVDELELDELLEDEDENVLDYFEDDQTTVSGYPLHKQNDNNNSNSSSNSNSKMNRNTSSNATLAYDEEDGEEEEEEDIIMNGNNGGSSSSSQSATLMRSVSTGGNSTLIGSSSGDLLGGYADSGSSTSVNKLFSSQDNHQLQEGKKHNHKKNNLLKDIKIFKGRPDFRLIANEYFGLGVGGMDSDVSQGNAIGSNSGAAGSGSWVIACGPEGLVSQAHKWSQKYPNVEFFGEKYVL